jgi:uncharacterized small protein (DUF1192 family)
VTHFGINTFNRRAFRIKFLRHEIKRLKAQQTTTP